MPAPFWTVSSLPLTVLTLKRITTFPKQKLWMKSSLSTTESMWHHLQITANLKRGIKKAKRSHKLRIKEPFKSNSDPGCMWQGIQAITGYRPTNTSTPSSDASLHNELNHFYGHFDRDNKEVAIKAVLPADHQPLTLSPTDVHAALSE